MSAIFSIRLGIVGTGFIVERIIRAAKQEPRIILSAIYSRSMERAADFADKYDIPHKFTSLEQMASSWLIDAVYIASPNSCHAMQSILFMRHGKHVLCEKPLASNAMEVRSMIEASEEFNVALMEAVKSTPTPNFMLVAQQLEKIAPVRRYFACYCQYSSRLDSLKRGIVLNAFKPELSNGAAMDIGIYTIYPMVSLFGRPKKIDAVGVKLITGVDGQGAVNFEYDEMIATVLYSKIADSSLPCEIQGDGGTIVIDRIESIDKVEVKLRGKNSEVVSESDLTDGYCCELKEFADLIEQGRRESDINSHKTSLTTIEIIDQIRKQIGVVYPADGKHQ